MKEDSNLCIHIGLPRTGNNFLKYEVFPNLKNVNIIEKIDFMTLFKNDKINLISNDNLSFITPLIKNNEYRIVILYRLKGLFPNAKIIIGVRERSSLIRSYYFQQIKEGYYKKYYEWLNEIDVSYFDYENYIEIIKALFDDVFIYKYEDLKNNADQVISNICNFLDTNITSYNNRIINSSFNKKQLKFMLFFNKLLKNKINKKTVFPYFIIRKTIIKIFEEINIKKVIIN